MDYTSNVSIGEEVIVKKADSEKEKQDARSVRSKVFIDEQNVPAELEYDLHDEDPATVHLVAYAGNKPAGAARMRQTEKAIGKAERVAVLKEARGRGIGALLMREMENWAKEAGIDKIKLNAQLHAENFYSQLGYKKVGDPFLEANIEHIAMVKNLME